MSKLKDLFNRDFSLTLGVERRIWVPALIFTLSLTCFESLVFGNGFVQFIRDLSGQGDLTYLAIGVIYLIAALYISFVFFTAALASAWRYKPIYLLVFGLVVFAEYGYSKALGRFTNFYDIVSAFSATPQQTIDSIYAYLQPHRTLAAGGACRTLHFLKKHEETIRARTALVRGYLGLCVLYSLLLH